nr:MAG TPA: hypothetical protein [Herelleviridae sp.]
MARGKKRANLTEIGAVQAKEVIKQFERTNQRDNYARYLEGYIKKLSARGEMEENFFTRDEYELQLEALKYDTREDIAALKVAYNSGAMSKEQFDKRMYNARLTAKNWNRALIDEQAYGMTKAQAEAAVEVAKTLKGIEAEDYKDVRKIARQIRRGELLTKEDWDVIRDELYKQNKELGDWDAAFDYIGKTYFGS